MKNLEYFIYPTQEGLYAKLRKMYKGKTICWKYGFVLVRGEAPIMLVAHLDTVHKEPVKHICKTEDGNILMSPQGIGGDDRCGVYALAKAYELAQVKPWLLFTCDEEVGGRGADRFCSAYLDDKLPKQLKDLKLIIEIDRRGSNDAVYYDCDNKDLEDYITGKGFQTEYGSFSDISYIAPDLGVAAVNLSSGYYNAHTTHEYINRKQLESVIERVSGIVAEATQPDFPKYEYIEKKLTPIQNDWGSKFYWNDLPKKKVKPKGLPAEYLQMYDELLDYYEEEELEGYRKLYGDKVIAEMYDTEIAPMYVGGDWEELK